MPRIVMSTDVELAKSSLLRGASDFVTKPVNIRELPIVIERNLTRRRLEVARLKEREAQVLFEALKAGAHGYLLKNVEPEELFRTLRGVVRGEAFVTPSMAAKILDEFTRQAQPPRGAGSAGLSPRERQVLELLTRGRVNKEIAATLEITENTVKNHLKSIMEKLHLENRVQVVAWALREGLVRPHDTP